MDSSILMTIGSNIRKYRISKQISIDEFAERLGVSVAFIGLVERGKRSFKLENLLKICTIFNITLNDLVYENNQFENVSNTKNITLNSLDAKIENINFLLTDLEEIELDFIIKVIKAMKNMSNEKFDRLNLSFDCDNDCINIEDN